ncbi:MAG: hypothetical protein WAT74_18280 [Flavobacteriales bacterium]
MFADTRPDSAIMFGAQALDLAGKLSFEPGVAEALRVIGFGHMREQEYGIAISHLQRALALWALLGDAGKQRRGSTSHWPISLSNRATSPKRSSNTSPA